MLKSVLRKLFSGGYSPEAVPAESRFRLGNGYYYEYDDVPNGLGGYCMVNMFLLKADDPDFRRCIVDAAGRIQNFSGIRHGEWEKALEFPLTTRVRFVFRIGAYKNGKAAVSWMLQPDGRYFGDEDGFGAEYCEEITLYSCLDEDGKFTEPFYYQE